jgi:glycosyltransferase involved in cell wall biosynthesis
MRSKNIQRGKIRVIHNGIDVSLFHKNFDREDTKLSLGIATNEKVVTIIGRLSEEKGHRIFFKAAQTVVQTGKKVKFLVVGDGPLADDLKKEARRLGMDDRIIFTGIRKDIPQILATSDMMVNASSIEGLPMTILEAMAARVPIIATPVGAVPQVISNGRNGILVAVGDDAGLARAIVDLLGSEDRRRVLAEEAFRTVNEKFNTATMAERYWECYRDILSGVR